MDSTPGSLMSPSPIDSSSDLLSHEFLLIDKIPMSQLVRLFIESRFSDAEFICRFILRPDWSFLLS